MSNDIVLKSKDTGMPSFFEILMDSEKLKALENGCKQIAQSDFIPLSMKKNPMNILIAMQMGMQLGLPELQSLQDIAVINGKPSLYGDGFAAVVMNHPQYVSRTEEVIYNDNNVPIGYQCTVIRNGHDPHTKTYTLDDAKRSQLLGKPGEWTKNPLRMCQMRARSFALRDMFPDALRGIASAEEQMDYIDGSIVSAGDTVSSDKLLTQTEKVKASYNARKNHAERKELTHENNATIDAKSSHVDTGSKTIASEGETNEYSKPIEVGQAGIDKDSLNDSDTESKEASQSQIESIENLAHERNFPVDRMRKALNHYGVSIISELTFQQANEFIEILNKEEINN